MTNIVKFEAKPIKEPEVSTREMFQLNVYQDSDGMYQVEMAQEEDFSDFDCYIALECVAEQFGQQHGFVMEATGIITEGPANDNS